MKDNPTFAIYQFAKKLNFPIAAQKINDELLTHPDYPSLLAVSDVLTSFKIENGAYSIPIEELTKVPCPFIAHKSSNGGEFCLVEEVANGNFLITDEKRKKHSVSTGDFAKTYSGTILAAEPADKPAVRNFIKSFLAENKLSFATTGLLTVILVSVLFHTRGFAYANWQLIVLSLIKTAGLITCILLIIQSIDSNNPLVQKLCNSGSKNNCNNILSSNAAKVFEGLTWSEVGLFYFTGTWLLLMFGNNSAAVWHVLAFMNFISLPYTVYSLYYQARVAKQWCVMCCTVQALLWLEFIPLVTYVINHLPVLGEGWYNAFISLFIAMLLPVSLWVLLKPLLLARQQLQPLKYQLQKFKYNADVFGKILSDQPKYAQPDEDWSIVLGNVEANTIITMVTNPYCPPCASTHKLLHHLIEQRSDIQARIVFTADNSDKDIKTPVSRHLMTLHGLKDKKIVKQALYDWYEQKQKNYKAWAETYPIELDENEYNKINKQKKWCELAEVKATPTLLLNGYKLPQLYQLNDLKYMLE